MDKELSELDIQFIKGVGPARAKLFNRLGIKTVYDAFHHLPCRYEDRSRIKKICTLQYGAVETVSGKIASTEIVQLPGRRLKIFELIVNDGTGLVKGKWFNQPFLKKNFRLGQDVILHGTVKRNPYWGIGFEMDNPEYEIISEDDSTVHMHRIVPVYRATSGLSVRQIRTVLFTIVHSYLEDMPDPLPFELRQKMSLPGLSDALLHLHFPGTDTDLTSLNTATSAFHRRLAFDELFMLELGLAVMKNNSAREKGISFHSDGKLVKKLRGTLPFTLTHAQEKVFGEILRDMQSPYPMHRLIQGDVGCGKTIVALMAMLEAAECGYQSALMAPTEILAEQHFEHERQAYGGACVRRRPDCRRHTCSHPGKRPFQEPWRCDYRRTTQVRGNAKGVPAEKRHQP
jgi:ATP-dependent DNA helicase RecG